MKRKNVEANETNPAIDNVDSFISSPANPEVTSLRDRAKNIAKIVGASVLLGTSAVTLATNAYWFNKIGNYNETEALLIDAFKQEDGTKCPNKAVALGAGVSYRNTPQSIGRSLPFKLIDNRTKVIDEDQPDLINRPVWYTDGSKNTWAGFNPRKLKSEEQNQTLSDNEIGDNLKWVNVSQLIEQDNPKKPKLIRILDLTNSSSSSTTKCTLQDNGEFVAGNIPVAYQIPNDINMFTVGLGAK